MKTRMFVIPIALLASVSLSRADITGYTLAPDGTTITGCSFGFATNSPGNYQLSISGNQMIAGPGQVQGSISTDGTGVDPTLALSEIINNDTASTWSDYHVQVTMGTSFTISGVGVANPGWTSVITAPTIAGTNSLWVGSIDYYSGNLITPGNILGFSYSVSFISASGAVSFDEQLMPSVVVVPEPGTTVLAVMGGLFLAGWTVRRRHSVT